jgi:hypothetical protein
MVRQLYPDGVDAALELVGTPTLPDTLRSVRIHGTVCFTGLLSNQWTVKEFYPIDYIPAGVRLTAYEGSATDLPREAMQRVLRSPTAPCPSRSTTSTTAWSRFVRLTPTWRTTRQTRGQSPPLKSSAPLPGEPRPQCRFRKATVRRTRRPVRLSPRVHRNLAPTLRRKAKVQPAPPAAPTRIPPTPIHRRIQAHRSSARAPCCWSGVTDGGAGHHYCLSRTTNRFPTTRQR